MPTPTYGFISKPIMIFDESEQGLELITDGTPVGVSLIESGAAVYSDTVDADAEGVITVEAVELDQYDGQTLDAHLSLSGGANVTVPVLIEEIGEIEDPNELPELNEPREFSAQTMMSGHSWVNNGMPVNYDTIADAISGEAGPATLRSVINGSDWAYRWNEAETYPWTPPNVNAKGVLEAGTPQVDVFVVMYSQHLGVTQSAINYGVLWSELAHSAGAECYFYSTHGRNSYDGTDNAGFEAWADDNDNRIAIYESLLESVNASQNPAVPKVRLVPVNVVYRRIWNEIQAESAPSDFNEMYRLFGDTHETLGDSHPSYLGRYVIALVHYATIYRRNPIDAPPFLQTVNQASVWGQDQEFEPATLEWLCNLIWDEVRDYPFSGVRQFVDPDPDWIVTTALDEVVVWKSPTSGEVTIYARIVGETDPGNYLSETGEVPISFAELPSGVYEFSEDQTNWHGPVDVAGVPSSTIQLSGFELYGKPGNPLTSEGPNSASDQGGDGIDLNISQAQDGEFVLIIGAHQTNNSSLLYNGTLGPAATMGPAMYEGFSGLTGFSGSQAFVGAVGAVKQPEWPEIFSNVSRFHGSHGVQVYLTGVASVEATDPVFSTEGVTAIDLPQIDNVEPGDWIINMVQIAQASRTVTEQPDATTLINATSTAPNSMYASYELAYASTVPARTISMNGSAAPMRGWRLVVKQAEE